MGSARTTAAVAIAALLVSGCAGSSRTILTGENIEALSEAVEQAGGTVLSRTTGSVTAQLTRSQQQQILAEETAEANRIGGVRWRTFLPDGTALFEYPRGDIIRALEGQAGKPASTIIYLLDGQVTGASGSIEGPRIHPGGPERCSRHGDLVADIVAEAVREAQIVSIAVLCDTVDREAVLLALDWIVDSHPNDSRGIINASFTLTDGEDIRKALTAVEEAGMLVTWAAGNRSRNACDGAQTPTSDSIILVGAGVNGEPDPRSNSGECIDVWVDGTRTDSGITHWGTSIAAPRVAATLANLWQSMPHLSGNQVAEMYLQHATFPGPEEGTRWAATPVLLR